MREQWLSLEQDQALTRQSGEGFASAARSEGEGALEVRRALSDTAAGGKTSRDVAGIPGIALRSGSDIRGLAVAGNGQAPTLTAEVASCVGYAFALWLAKTQNTSPDKLTVAVGRDPRLHGEALKRALIGGLTAADCDVLDCGLTTTPALCTLSLGEANGAVMVTASHQAPEKNGFKLLAQGGGLTSAQVEEILAEAQKTVLPQRLVTERDALSPYQERLAQMVRERLDDFVQCPLLGMHVIVDAGNGSGGFYARFLEELGVETTGSRCLEPDGHFPDHLPNPESREALTTLAEIVRENTADLGVLFDADCDRVALVDERGRIVNGNRLIALIAAILLEEQPGATIVTDSVTSSGVARFITEWGGVHYRYKRGYRNVIDEAKRLNDEGIDCPLAIETSGHAAFKENQFIDDGLYLATRILCAAMERKRAGLTIGTLIDELQEPVESAEVRLTLRSPDIREASQAVIEAVLSHTLDNPAWHLAPDNREGVRIAFDLEGGVDNAWFMMRLSVHDPVMPVNAQSDVPGGVKRMLGELYALLSNTAARELIDLEPLKTALG